jgi:hypothetical protein
MMMVVGLELSEKCISKEVKLKEERGREREREG